MRKTAAKKKRIASAKSAKRLVRAPSSAAQLAGQELALPEQGFALIHKRERKIVLESVRNTKIKVKLIGETFKVNGSYRVGAVKVSETP